MILDMIVKKSDDGVTAEIPSLKGCETWAHGEEEAIDKVIEMAAFYLKTDPKKIKIDKARGSKSHSVFKLVFNKS